MFELNGKYNSCKVFSDAADDAAVAQLIALMNQQCVEGNKIRIMPDYHAGKGSVIGTTMTLTDKVIPNVVGVDIGCGMLAVKLKEKRIDFPALDSVIRKRVPAGFCVHDEAVASSGIGDMYCADSCDLSLAERSLGSLGGGNHFIEVDRDSEGFLWLVIHTGSRHLGLEVCGYYQELGYKKLQEKNAGGSYKELSKELIARYKEIHCEKEISKALKALKNKFEEAGSGIPYALAFVEGEDFRRYLHDMSLVQEHASINRETIAKIIMKYAKLHELERFETIHNYIDVEHKILRKGSVSAQLGERLIIPMNMRDGSLICVGKGNEDWNCSAPHGAGRIMSRSVAKESISMKEFKESMTGIFTTSVSRSTLDESPMAYKPMDSIVEQIIESVDIIDTIKPVYNFKAGEDD